jgi:hypothetical protein
MGLFASLPRLAGGVQFDRRTLGETGGLGGLRRFSWNPNRPKDKRGHGHILHITSGLFEKKTLESKQAKITI